MKHLLCSAALMLVAFSGSAQAVRFSTQGRLPIESQPALGYEQADYLGMGDHLRLSLAAFRQLCASSLCT
jgi:hypothetical protein